MIPPRTVFRTIRDDTYIPPPLSDPDSEMEMEPPEKEGDASEFKLPELPDFGKLLGGLLGDDK